MIRLLHEITNATYKDFLLVVHTVLCVIAVVCTCVIVQFSHLFPSWVTVLLGMTMVLCTTSYFIVLMLAAATNRISVTCTLTWVHHKFDSPLDHMVIKKYIRSARSVFLTVGGITRMNYAFILTYLATNIRFIYRTNILIRQGILL